MTTGYLDDTKITIGFGGKVFIFKTMLYMKQDELEKLRNRIKEMMVSGIVMLPNYVELEYAGEVES